MAVSVIKNDNFPNAVAPTIANPLFTQLQGGYQRKGKQVIVNLGVYVNGTFNANDYFTVFDNLPIPNVQVALAVATHSNKGKGASATVQNNGRIRVDSGVSALSYETLYISGIYTTA